MKNGHVDAAWLLLDKGAEVDRATKDGWTPLFIACQKGHVDVARLLLECDAEVDLATKKGTTPLFTACARATSTRRGCCWIKARTLIGRRENGTTPLYIACENGHVDAARLLLDKGAEVDRATKDG